MARSLELRNGQGLGRNIGRIAYIPNRNMPVGGQSRPVRVAGGKRPVRAALVADFRDLTAFKLPPAGLRTTAICSLRPGQGASAPFV
jgi:hypothetical protein